MDNLLDDSSEKFKSASVSTADYVNENRGATSKIIDEIFQWFIVKNIAFLLRVSVFSATFALQNRKGFGEMGEWLKPPVC